MCRSGMKWSIQRLAGLEPPIPFYPKASDLPFKPGSRPTLSQLWGSKIMRTTFLKNKILANLLISRLNIFEKVGRIVPTEKVMLCLMCLILKKECMHTVHKSIRSSACGLQTITGRLIFIIIMTLMLEARCRHIVKIIVVIAHICNVYLRLRQVSSYQLALSFLSLKK